MAESPLTIRNLTSSLIELKLLERFENAQSNNAGNFTLITKPFSGLLSNATTLSSSQLATKSETFTNTELSVPIGPFETKITDIRLGARETLRLTFEVESQRYRVDIPTPSSRSTVLTPLSPNPQHEFTAVYLPTSSHLSIYSSANLESWMSKLRSETPLSALSIPGTHNSPTCYKALPSVRCQAVSVKRQLENGVRFLDIRVQPQNPSDASKEELILVHSAFPISLTGNKYLRDLIKVIFAFLDNNPTETVIISLKREGVGKSTDQQLSKILHDHYATDPNRWFTENRVPTLGEARSKIVIIRRFAIDDSLKGENNGTGWCIDAESWPDNCEDGLCSSGEIRVQDFYEVGEHENIEKKIGYATGHLDRAAKCVCVLHGKETITTPEAGKRCFYINFLSASNFWRANCWPDRIAHKVNPKIVDHLCRSHARDPEGDGGTGIVVCDWVGIDGDWDLIRCIVGHNAKLELLER
ncbi:phosphatidylinositol phospholipase-like protein C [Bisporella sp. PMI_857]|nr:phosphatidylinositol phospholipase-like protein C [Bisporella sp. PMI_857]